MIRIGTSKAGGAIIEIAEHEVRCIRAALDLLESVVAEDAGPADGDVSVLRIPARVQAQSSTHVSRGVRACRACGKTKPPSDFYDRAATCKACTLARQAKARKATNAKAGTQKAAPLSEKIAPDTKVCRACGTRKPLRDFDKYQQSCRECKAGGDEIKKRAKAFVAGLPARPHSGECDAFRGLGAPVEHGRKARVGGEG